MWSIQGPAAVASPSSNNRWTILIEAIATGAIHPTTVRDYAISDQRRQTGGPCHLLYGSIARQPLACLTPFDTSGMRALTLAAGHISRVGIKMKEFGIGHVAVEVFETKRLVFRCAAVQFWSAVLKGDVFIRPRN